MPDLKITSRERILAKRIAQSDPERRRELLERFWYNRMLKKDPVARIGLALWCHDSDKLKKIIALGDKAYWNNRNYQYWRSMGLATFVNLAAGLEREGFDFDGNTSELVKKIEYIGAKIAKRHAQAVTVDHNKKIGKVPGLLSLEQMAKYHHAVFEEEGIPRHYYGGTRNKLIPDEWEFELYGDLYCHDCDPRP